MPEYTCTEIDEIEDWIVAESLMKRFILNKKERDFSKIKIFLSDVDGVLTDAGMYYTENGDEFKKFCTYDGMGMQLLQKSGIKVGILTSEDKQINRRRSEKLNLDFDFHGATDKLQIVKDLCESEKITLNDVAYIGACTGAKLSDLRMAASVLKGKKLASGVRLLVAPASLKDQETAKTEGIMQIFEDIGASILPNSC